MCGVVVDDGYVYGVLCNVVSRMRKRLIVGFCL